MPARDDIAFLVGSEKRVRLLRALSAAADSPSNLATRCSCARETAQRTLRGFRERGWVQKVEGEYALTGAGQIVLDAYDAMEQSVEAADRLADFLLYAEDVVADLPRSVLRELEVTNATTEDPHAPIDRFLSVIGTEPVSSFRGITPIVSRIFNESVWSVVESESTVELVLDESVLETSEREYPVALRRAFELDNMELYVSPAPLTFGLAIIDDRVFVGAYTEAGNLIAGIDGSEDQFVRWAENLFERRKAGAQPVEQGDVAVPSYQPDSD
jgi:predicted transcriptional regulator